MSFNSDIHHRNSIRLRDYDYSSAGAYFVTICAWQRECVFGEISDGEMRLNETGRLVDTCWRAIAGYFQQVSLDEFVVMPNHLHGIIVINSAKSIKVVGAKQVSSALPAFGGNSIKAPDSGLMGEADESLASPLHGTQAGSLGAIIQNFKSISARRINKFQQTPGCPIWQRNYYERVIRTENELARAREYIVNNPLKWELDKDNPRHCL